MTSSSMLLGFFGGIGPTELIVIGVVALLLFGRRLPDMMKGIGVGMRQFRKGLDGEYDEKPKQVEGQVRDGQPPAAPKSDTPPPPNP